MKKVALFDWGGVLAPSDNKTAADLLYEKYTINKEAFRNYCKDNEDQYGDTDEDGGFLELASKEFGIPEEEIAQALNSASPNEGYALAKKVAEKHKTCLVSNQIKFRTDFIKSTFDLSFFDTTYFSNEIQKLKPNREFFKYVLSDIGRNAEDCVFIDDNTDNIEVAKEMGFDTIHVESTEQMKDELQKKGML